ncbi:MAG: DUF362 domain-containing protein [Propionibacteriaceae bacterium]|jgi:uncharacterized Fe-S center protein|nr:DUF362 domain-containing protein [Propionibacteriaceae bacterium]
MDQAAKVVFTSSITPEAMVRVFDAVGVELSGAVAVKLHSGEMGNQNFTKPDFVKPIIDHVHGVIVEGNTAYEGSRDTTVKHWETMKQHGWTDIAEVDILDEEGEIELPVPDGQVIKTDIVGSHLTRYDSMLVLTHFKGHPMGGFGGSLKNISIGVASSKGKTFIHSAGDLAHPWKAEQDAFLDSMADAAKAVVDHFGPGLMVFINVMKDMSVDCDCCAVAEDPAMGNIGVLASLDPVALDQACVDLVYASTDPGKAALIERIESKHGIRTVESAAALGVGTRQYELVTIDEES